MGKTGRRPIGREEREEKRRKEEGGGGMLWKEPSTAVHDS